MTSSQLKAPMSIGTEKDGIPGIKGTSSIDRPEWRQLPIRAEYPDYPPHGIFK
jgi:hypothetical protein